MADRSLQLSIRGSKALRRALKAAEDMEGLKELRAAHAEVGGIVVDKAQQIASGQGAAAQRAAGTLRLSRSTTGASIKLGEKIDMSGNTSGQVGAYALGWEFGATRNKPRVGPNGRKFVGYRQFPPQSRYNKDTGFLYPAIHAESDRVFEAYTRAMDRIIERITAEGPDE